jgi:hypothetical protein
MKPIPFEQTRPIIIAPSPSSDDPIVAVEDARLRDRYRQSSRTQVYLAKTYIQTVAKSERSRAEVGKTLLLQFRKLHDAALVGNLEALR